MTTDSAAPNEVQPGYYKDPTGYFEWRYFDPADGWSAKGIYLGSAYDDSSRDVSNLLPPTGSRFEGDHEPAKQIEEPVVSRSEPVAPINEPTKSNADHSPESTLLFGGAGAPKEDVEATPNEAPDGGPIMRVRGDTWVKWNGSSWIDYSTGEEVPTPPVHGGPPPMVGNLAPLAGSPESLPSIPPPPRVSGPVPYIPGPSRGQARVSHTGRNIFLVILGLCLLGFGGCAVLVAVGIGGAANEAQKAKDNAIASGTPTCQGVKYLDAQPADTCANADGSLNVDNFTIGATPLVLTKQEFGNDALCSTVTMKNTSAESLDYNAFNFKIQTPSGDVATDSATGFGGSLNSGVVVRGGTKTGLICAGSAKIEKGQYVLIYDPSPVTDQRGIWLTKIK